MVRQIALEFLHRERGTRLIPESDETTLAIAAILAESNRKMDWTIKHLAPISIPYWIVQVSERSSILLSAFGESSLRIELSEDTSLGPIRRIISNEIRDFDDNHYTEHLET